MRKITKTLLITGIILFIYGYLCREIPIYFFWSSLSISWMFLLAALFSYLLVVHHRRKIKHKRNFWTKFGIGFTGLGLLILPIVLVLLLSSEAYIVATDYLRQNQEIKNEIGQIKGFGLFRSASVNTYTVNGIETGSAYFHLIIRGSKKFTDKEITLVKVRDRGWIVKYIY